MDKPKGLTVEALERHLVPIHFTLNQDGREIGHIISAFVLEVRGYWFLITAGHCLREIEEFRENGVRIKNVGLMDSLPESAPHKQLVPYHYDPDEIFWCFDEGGAIDYGVLPLDDYRSMLEKNGVIALDEQTWKATVDDADLYVLLGVVGELTKSDCNVANISRGVASIEPVENVKGVFSKADIPMFYGKFPKNERTLSPKGMSGGPIFAVQIIDGKLRYWLHAIQSQWVSGTREIAACPIFPIANLIEDTLREIENEQYGETRE